MGLVRTRREREEAIVDATRALFDDRGAMDAPIDEIARAVGINKALIYRHFSSKEELFVRTVTRYLGELSGRLEAVPAAHPETTLRELSERFVAFCLEHPAFVDCAISLMRRPYAELAEQVADPVRADLGRLMARCLGPLARTLEAGAARGVFAVDDADRAANVLYAQSLGALHLARVGAGVREAAPGVAEVFAVDPADVGRACVDAAVAFALGVPGRR